MPLVQVGAIPPQLNPTVMETLETHVGPQVHPSKSVQATSQSTAGDFAPSVQVLLAQNVEVQSVEPRHLFPRTHLAGHTVPPQSTSVSSWFLVASVHVASVIGVGPVGRVRVVHVPLVHVVPLTQSVAARQVFPIAHLGHVVPPQSIADSP